MRVGCEKMNDISIHAPPRGATLHGANPHAAGRISIHAPPRGATSSNLYKVKSGTFQFTPLREGRPSALAKAQILKAISIHAPPRGATRGLREERRNAMISIHAPPRGAAPSRCRNESRGSRFQFTPLREGRHRLDGEEGSIYIFQFTPLREGRLPSTRAAITTFYFNSRPSARGDVRTWSNWDGTSISIHAPPRGATVCYGRIYYEIVFQFTPLREGRLCVRCYVPACRIFQFTPLREGRPADSKTAVKRIYFNSRPSARGDWAADGVE